MAINLVKGQTIDLRKNDKGENFDLSKVTIGLGWDVRKKESGFFGKLIGNKEEDYDLDAIAFMLDSNDKISNLGKTIELQNGQKIALVQSDIIYFNNITAPSATGPSAIVYGNQSKGQILDKVKQLLNNGEYIVHTGDNLTGDGEGDDEQIIVVLDKIPQRINKILFLVCIYQGTKKNQHFGMLDNAFIRAIDAKGVEIGKYSLSGEAAYNNKRSMVFAELYRKDTGWKFRALGEALDADNFIEILQAKYLPKN
jgi:stress response protein SCP2